MNKNWFVPALNGAKAFADAILTTILHVFFRFFFFLKLQNIGPELAQTFSTLHS